MMPDATEAASPRAYCRHRIAAASAENRSPDEARQAAYAAYLHHLNELAASEVWLVDRETRTFTYYGDSDSIRYEELPTEAEAMLERLFAGEAVTSGDFSAFLGTPSVTSGIALKDSEGNIKGALLLHRTLVEMRRNESDALRMLATALGLAFLLAALVSWRLARRFIRPLRQMEATAAALADGHYESRTAIDREDEIGALAKSLDTLAARLADADAERNRLSKLRQDFLAEISHELRTPITVLRGSLELFSSGFWSDVTKRQESLRQMQENLRALERLVGDLFELTRLQNADFTIDCAAMNLPDALTDAIRAARRMASEKGVAIEIAETIAPIPFLGDYGRLRQMFLTVLDNAVKFSPAGRAVEVTVESGPESWRVMIRDHGAGIAAEDLPHIFERFHRSHSGENSGGTGLGLAIAKAIAERHAIAVTCQSTPGEETVFSFSGLPAPSAKMTE